MNFIIATRRSKLAQVQTEIIIDLLNKKHNIKCEKLLIETLGDKILEVSLDKIGGKGLFVKDIEMAMLEQRADAAVHSMKDVPYEMPKGFEIIAIPKREDVRDAFISLDNVKFKDLRKGAKIGTSSRRRAAQLKLLRPDLQVVPIRGNVQTRIDKIRKENLDGIILAVAGLKRINLEHLITDYFDAKEMVPAVGQGALGVEVRCEHSQKNLFKDLDHYNSRVCVAAERAFMRELDGDCHSTIGAYASIKGEKMHIIGMFEVNNEIVKKEIIGIKEQYEKLGIELADRIIKS
ncbi:hydroxymethylbilane synthase [Clostridium sp. Marseille-Q2269]|uniref:hydroxymethylbilane synthase n=1 Tax=Clostridium sp. Marseille-Q2269 TaxID=2942205 RepID=UPI0020745093|nr:hydroxymethylbilane synthase [Clostridium sp. Marseille-Q2269]